VADTPAPPRRPHPEKRCLLRRRPQPQWETSAPLRPRRQPQPPTRAPTHRTIPIRFFAPRDHLPPAHQASAPSIAPRGPRPPTQPSPRKDRGPSVAISAASGARSSIQHENRLAKSGQDGQFATPKWQVPAFGPQSQHRAAIAPACVTRLRPATAQPGRHLGRRGALSRRCAKPKHPDADRVDPFVHGIPPVTVLVPPLLVSRVRGRPVDLHACPVFLVEVVQVPVASALPYPHLP